MSDPRATVKGGTKIAVTFYRQWAAFPVTKMNGQPDAIVVCVSPYGADAGGNYGFGIEHVGTETGRYPIALQAQLFADSWRAFRDLPEFFDLLADLDESTGVGQSRLGLADLIPSLEAMGWTDITDRFRHPVKGSAKESAAEVESLAERLYAWSGGMFWRGETTWQDNHRVEARQWFAYAALLDRLATARV